MYESKLFDKNIDSRLYLKSDKFTLVYVKYTRFVFIHIAP